MKTRSTGSGLISSSLSFRAEGLSEVEGSSEISIKRHKVLLGLYKGIPLIRRDPGYFGMLPNKITIFQKPIEDEATSKNDIKDMVRDTVWHEIAHHNCDII